jgi:RimJ/RimL family protein N-acetyltransferase
VPDDLDFVAELFGNPDVVAHLHPPLQRDGARKWLGRNLGPLRRYRAMWPIVDNESHAVVGLAGIRQTEIENQILPVVQCLVTPSHWRKGYGTDAVDSCLHLVHDPPSWEDDEQPSDAYALIRPENAAGIALARKLGMTQLRTVQHDGHEHLLFVGKNRQK